ncbi:MAG: hypothetical protein UY87_C0096G0001, partial [Candidatus Peribacteria bacterium GW2011_GWC2_54_8]
ELRMTLAFTIHRGIIIIFYKKTGRVRPVCLGVFEATKVRSGTESLRRG